jgi:ketosteroid isomerase-like protein
MLNRYRGALTGWAALGVAAALCAAGCGSTRQRRAHLDSLVGAERAFASACAAKGIKSGFLSYLAEDGVVFRPRPVNGVGWYSQSAEPDGRLAWEPVYADVSESADLGYTTGPWTFSDENGRAVAHGEYVSVWRRTPGGDWRVSIDVGISHSPPDLAVEAPGTARYAPAGGASDSDSAGGKAERRRLSAVSQKFFRAWSARGMEAAYRETAGDGVLVLRAGEFPVRGKGAAIPLIRGEEIPSAIEAMGGALASSGDLGYTYGVIGWGPAGGGERRESSYLWVWKRSRGGKWEIVVDVMVPCDERE